MRPAATARTWVRNAVKWTSTQPPAPLRTAYTGASGRSAQEATIRSVMLESAGGMPTSSVADSWTGLWFCTVRAYPFSDVRRAFGHTRARDAAVRSSC